MLTWQAHTGGVTSLAFVPGGGLVSTGADGVLKSWDTLGGMLRDEWELGEPKSETSRVLVNASGSHAAVLVPKSMMSLRFIELSRQTQNFHYRIRHLHTIASAPDAASVFVVGTQLDQSDRARPPGRVLIQISYPPTKVIATSKTQVSERGIAINHDATEVLVGKYRYKWPDGERMPFEGPSLVGAEFAISPDGDKLFGVNGTRLMVWGYQVGALRRKLKGHMAPITGLISTTDGRRLWTASADASVRQWDVDTERCEKCYGLQIGPLGCVAVSPDGLTAAAGSSHNGMIAVWDLD